MGWALPRWEDRNTADRTLSRENCDLLVEVQQRVFHRTFVQFENSNTEMLRRMLLADPSAVVAASMADNLEDVLWERLRILSDANLFVICSFIQNRSESDLFGTM